MLRMKHDVTQRETRVGVGNGSKLTVMKSKVRRLVLGKLEDIKGICSTQLHVYLGLQIKVDFFLFGSSRCYLRVFSKSMGRVNG